MATVRTVKDLTLFFLHLICIVLSGWYGFHNLSGRPSASAPAGPGRGHGHGHGHGQTPLLQTSQRIQQSARLSIAFGSLTFVNVLLFVAVKLCEAKLCFLKPTNFLMICLSFALGGALIVMVRKRQQILSLSKTNMGHLFPSAWTSHRSKQRIFGGRCHPCVRRHCLHPNPHSDAGTL